MFTNIMLVKDPGNCTEHIGAGGHLDDYTKAKTKL